LPVDSNAKLIDYIIQRDETDIKLFVDSNNVDLSKKDDRGWTALHHAIWRCHGEVAKQLFDETKIHSKKNEDHPIHLAVERGDVQAFEMLSRKGRFNLDSKGRDGQTVLHRACWSGSRDITLRLLEASVNVDITNTRERTTLHEAAEKGHLEIVEFLLLQKANVTKQDKKGRTALHLAIMNGYGNEGVVKLLIEQQPNIETLDGEGKAALHYAAEKGHAPLVQLLVNKTTQPGLRVSQEQTALHLAAFNGHTESVRYLVEKIDPGIKDSRGQTALHLAAESVNADMIRLLITHQEHIEAEDANGYTAIERAIRKGNAATALAILDSGGTIRNKEEKLLEAARRGFAGVIELLLKEKASINTSEQETGNTRLHIAVSRDDEHVIRSVSRYEPDYNQKNLEGYTPLHVAVKAGYNKCVRALIRAGANMEEDDSQGYKPLHLAAREGRELIVRTLVEHGAKIDAEDSRKHRPLYLAAKVPHMTTVLALIELGADIDGGTLCTSNEDGEIGVTKLLARDHIYVSTIVNFPVSRVHKYIRAQGGNIEESHLPNLAKMMAAKIKGIGEMLEKVLPILRIYGVTLSRECLVDAEQLVDAAFNRNDGFWKMWPPEDNPFSDRAELQILLWKELSQSSRFDNSLPTVRGRSDWRMGILDRIRGYQTGGEGDQAGEEA
jgi:ankyrin repeat protein